MHHWLAGARWHLIQMAHDAVVQLDQRVFLVLAHFKLHKYHAHGIARHAVGMVDAFHALQDGFQWLEDELFDFFRRSAGFLHDDIGGWHHNLRVFLARGDQERHNASQKAHEQNQQGQLAAGEVSGNASGDIELDVVVHAMLS